ncbi:putative bifunctional diguanylate cyclase/phosphodiesterase [Azospirillum thermophilum]|uniref:GGDEF-domain containing protein n=1 Tax=Azospirillum thermophilum TaxID=2202148 RepID=A0A2S2CKH7_9PROT|nr:bifunctional diguanylate cyclase/phosphodiesterase [Azospirillum thermophilum]AWK84870.1 GGDEF-domain containing protein [Azospirillum thermophilum]
MTPRALRSLTLKQTLCALAAAFGVGFAITAAEVSWTVMRERTEALERAAEVAALAQAPAAVAAYSSDGELGQRVLDGVMGARIVRWATIDLGRGRTLVERSRPREQETLPERLAASLLFGGQPVVERPLPVLSDRRETAGVLRIGIDTRTAAEDLLGYAATALLADLLRNLLIGLAVALALHRLLARPLAQIGRDVARIDPARPEDAAIAVPAGHEDDEIGLMVGQFNRKLSQLHREQGELQRLATSDLLTGLANRTLLIDRLTHAIELACRSKHRLAVLSVGLDRFKQVNDSLGYGVGDGLLRLAAQRLNESVRRCDSVGRFGGDEFLVILERVQDAAEAAAVAERLLAALSAPALVEGHRIHVAASVGIALHPDDATDGPSLVRMAEAAMHAAKADGGGRFVFYTGDLTERAMARLRLEASLREAVASGAFELFYQPKISAATGTLTGFEALVRWRHEGALVPPSDFIPVAEDTGLILEIGAWVMDEACRTAARWARDHAPVPVAVNVSARQLADAGFAAMVEEALRRNGTRPELLEVEITETVIMKDVRHHLPVLSRLRALGVRIAIDDFGTGYSSLAYLRQLPVDVLKIDRSFVSDLPHAPDIASTVIALAQRLFLSTVAEGVETEEQHRWLADAGCDCVQGFLISRPVPADAAEAMVLASAARSGELALTA